MAKWIASFEVDQRQRLILQADKLREMLGASRLIEQTVEIAEALRPKFPGVETVTPVSGVLRFTADDSNRLAPFLWELRLKIVEDLHLPSTITILQTGQAGTSDFKAAMDRLEERVRINKDAKTGVAARPSSPLFAQCMIQPQFSANRWDPVEYRKGDDTRRTLISDESAMREHESDDTYSSQFKQFQKLKDFGKTHKRSIWDALPKEFSNLAPGSEDSYLAFIKADGDGMGRLLMSLNWDALLPNTSGSEACLQFSQALEKCLDQATRNAVDGVTGNWIFSEHDRFPVAPLVRAGEDYWIVCRRDLAFPLVIALGNAYADLTNTTSPIPKARESVAELKDEPLTLSFGILFAKQGFPFEAQLHMAEALIRNAKRFRRDTKAKEGCVDYYWLESSAREDIISYREEMQTIADGDARFHLYTAPWTLTETGEFLKAADLLNDSDLASGKLKQLEMILRLGTDFCDLAYDQWLRMLDHAERDKFREAANLIPKRLRIPQDKPFQSPHLRTPLLDLLQLVEIRKGLGN